MAANAGRTASVQKPSRRVTVRICQYGYAKPSTSISPAAVNWADSIVGRRPHRSDSTPPTTVPSAPPTPYRPITRPARLWLKPRSLVR
jgi:hypothetical protein